MAQGIASGTSSGGLSSVSELTDTIIATPADGESLVFNSTSGKWENTVVAGGSSSIIHKFDVSGLLELPQETVTGGLEYNKSAFTISEAKAQVRVSGTSQYSVKVISYDNAGINPITHISENISLSDRTPLSMSITIASIGADRSIEMSLEQLTGTPSEDFSLTLS